MCAVWLCHLHSKYWVVRSLDQLGNNAVNDQQAIHLESSSWDFSGNDLLILLIEVVIECRTIVPAVAVKDLLLVFARSEGSSSSCLPLCGQIEFPIDDIRIKLV